MSQTVCSNKKGFTLVELMLAMAFFSFVLMFVISGFLLITRNYNQGVTSSRIHQAGRNLMEEMVRELKQSTTTPVFYRQVVGANAKQSFICYSEGTYRAWDQATNPDNYGRLAHVDTDFTSQCESSNDFRSSFDSDGSYRLLLDQQQIYITNLNLSPVSDKLFKLEMSLASSNITEDLGQDTDGDNFKDSCSVATVGNEFCDVVTLNTLFSIR